MQSILVAAQLAVLLAVPLVAAGTPAHAKVLENVPLVWLPTSQIGSRGPVVEIHSIEEVDPDSGGHASDTTGRLDIGGTAVRETTGLVRIQIDGLTDTRKNPRLIAENREDADEGKILPVTTRDDVGAWCTDRLRDLLGNMGFEVVESEGDVILSGQVLRFFVTETNTYEGDIGLKIQIESRDGRVLWAGITNGVATRFGRSYKLENYYEVISDSLLDAVGNLVEHRGFLRAVSARTGSGE